MVLNDLAPNAPGERRPTGKNARNSQKAYTVGRPLHWVVRHVDGAQSHASASAFRLATFFFSAFPPTGLLVWLGPRARAV